MTTGTGDTKEDATKNALRSALEQTYGAFVSSNSQVVNDELVKDEIVSISAGNIVSYEELSFMDTTPKQVTVKAVVSITRLQNYAKNKGMTAELDGNTFAMNLKMEELNIKNQKVALEHMLVQTKIMSKNLFDYELNVGEPEKTPKGVQILLTIRIKANDNTVAYYDYFHKTLNSLAVKKTRANVPCYKNHVEIPGFEPHDNFGICYVLRGEPEEDQFAMIRNNVFRVIGEAVLNCEIVDNIGNVSGFKRESNKYGGVTEDYKPTNKLSMEYYGGTGRSKGLRYYRDGYTKRVDPIFYLSDINGVYCWMNAAKPRVGERLYETKLFINYSVEEIGKISKIEIRPKEPDYAEEIARIGLDFNKFYQYYSKYITNSNEEDDHGLKEAYDLIKKIRVDPFFTKWAKSAVKPGAKVEDLIEGIDKAIKQIESGLNKQ